LGAIVASNLRRLFSLKLVPRHQAQCATSTEFAGACVARDPLLPRTTSTVSDGPWPPRSLKRPTATRTSTEGVSLSALPMVDRYTHVILDDDSGAPVGAVRDIDELEDGTHFGVVRRFDSAEPPTYMWLRGLLLLPVSEAAPHIRDHLAQALRMPQHA